jgi:hypothetical protein
MSRFLIADAQDSENKHQSTTQFKEMTVCFVDLLRLGLVEALGSGCVNEVMVVRTAGFLSMSRI